MNVPTKWTEGYDAAKKELFLKTLEHNKMLTDRIVEILYDNLQAVENTELSEDHFTNPEWPIRQALIMGQKKQIKQLLKLFDFRKK